mmetsp:Transcript_44534/g.127658  ORF Transcript_44534/g.127658 Transcript_44534/m.127658 type:complete len:210 (+) Transcript_44534:338-967(+)
MFGGAAESGPTDSSCVARPSATLTAAFVAIVASPFLHCPHFELGLHCAHGELGRSRLPGTRRNKTILAEPKPCRSLCRALARVLYPLSRPAATRPQHRSVANTRRSAASSWRRWAARRRAGQTSRAPCWAAAWALPRCVLCSVSEQEGQLSTRRRRQTNRVALNKLRRCSAPLPLPAGAQRREAAPAAAPPHRWLRTPRSTRRSHRRPP